MRKQPVDGRTGFVCGNIACGHKINIETIPDDRDIDFAIADIKRQCPVINTAE